MPTAFKILKKATKPVVVSDVPAIPVRAQTQLANAQASAGRGGCWERIGRAGAELGHRCPRGAHACHAAKLKALSAM